MNNTKFALQQELKDFYMDIPVYKIGDEDWVEDSTLSKRIYSELTISMSRKDEVVEKIEKFFSLRGLKCVVQFSSNMDDGCYGGLSVAWVENGEVNLYCFGTTYCKF